MNTPKAGIGRMTKEEVIKRRKEEADKIDDHFRKKAYEIDMEIYKEILKEIDKTDVC